MVTKTVTVARFLVTRTSTAVCCYCTDFVKYERQHQHQSQW